MKYDLQKTKNLIERGKELQGALKLEQSKILLGKHKYASRGRNLLSNSYKEVLPYYVPKDSLLIQAERKKKEELPLLERDAEKLTEFIRKERASRPSNLIVQEFYEVEPYDDKLERLLYFADKYRIPYFRNGIRKSYKDIARDVHKYEMVNKNKIKKLGLDKKYKIYGHYLLYV
jgi:hypothetical protein